ncbi:MAG: long-chain fatty acid--CoA ligase [Usitatibacter sp.]
MNREATASVPIDDDESIASVFAKRVAATPAKVAYGEFDAETKQWRSRTWEEVAALAGRVAAALAAEGLAPGDRVAIMLRNCVEWVAFDIGAYRAGLVVVPLYVEDRPENFGYILGDAGVKVLLVGGEEHWKRIGEVRDLVSGLQRIVTLKPVGEAGDPRVVAWTQWLDSGAQTNPHAGDQRRGGHDLATIVYTSGTTGKPKGVMLSHQNMLQNVKAALAVYDVYPGDLFLSFLPLSHMFERTVGCYLTMVAGSQVTFARSIQQLSEDFITVRPTIIVSVPRIFERLYAAIQASLESSPPAKRRMFELAHRTGWRVFEWRQGRAGFKPQFLLWPLLKPLVADKLLARLGGRVRLCISGGAALSASISHAFIGLGVPICQGYGLTEAAPIVSANTIERNEPASIGMPLPGVEVRLGDNSVLQARGPNVMLGYWGNPEATARVKDAEGWLDTGDQAKWKDGFLYITGRIKEILVLGNGEKVPPVDMELAILLDPLFEQVMVIGEGQPYLTALVVLNAAEAAKLGAVDEKLATGRIAGLIKGFPGYAQIRRVAIVDEKWTVENGLLTPTLKLRRAQVLERHRDRIEALYKGRRP